MMRPALFGQREGFLSLTVSNGLAAFLVPPSMMMRCWSRQTSGPITEGLLPSPSHSPSPPRARCMAWNATVLPIPLRRVRCSKMLGLCHLKPCVR